MIEKKKCVHVNENCVGGVSYMPGWMLKQMGFEIVKHESINSDEAVFCPICQVLVAEWYRIGIDRVRR